jgi:heme-degrading monooxygenase HmoA
MTIVEAEPDQADSFLSVLQEQVLPRARQWQGYRGVVSLIDRSTGKIVTVTFWETEEAMRASDESAGQLRSDAMADAGVSQPPTVERYEVAVFEV